jgi:hypothetical protein
MPAIAAAKKKKGVPEWNLIGGTSTFLGCDLLTRQMHESDGREAI